MASSKRLLILALFGLHLGTVAAQPNPGTCNADDGKYRTTTSGTFKIVCNFSEDTTVALLDGQSRGDFGSCIDACANKPGCQAVDWDSSNNSCILYKTATKGTRPATGKHNAYLEAVPPPQPTTATSSSAASSSSSTASSSTSTGSSSSSSSSSTSSSTPSATPDSGPSGTPDPGPTDPKIPITTNPSCKGTEGQAYIAADGTYFKIACGFHSTGNIVGDFQGVKSFAECIEKCSQTDKCISAQYMNDPPAPNYDANHCVLSDAEGPGAPGCEHWFAYTISPPATAEDKPFPYTLCQTVCPVSDGMVFESDSGENFRISCGKRHGTAILWTESTPTFDACMNSCGKVLACHSVDYNPRSQKCYHGTHIGEPTVPAPGFSSATTLGCSGACRKSCSCK